MAFWLSASNTRSQHQSCYSNPASSLLISSLQPGVPREEEGQQERQVQKRRLLPLGSDTTTDMWYHLHHDFASTCRDNEWRICLQHLNKADLAIAAHQKMSLAQSNASKSSLTMLGIYPSSNVQTINVGLSKGNSNKSLSQGLETGVSYLPFNWCVDEWHEMACMFCGYFATRLLWGNNQAHHVAELRNVWNRFHLLDLWTVEFLR